MDNQFWFNIIETILTAAVIPLLAWGIKNLVNWLKTKTNNAIVEKYLTYAGDAVTQAVKETTQTYVDALKKEGKFDKDAQIEAFNKTCETALKLLTTDALDVIEMVYGDVEAWLRSKIESTIAENK